MNIGTLKWLKLQIKSRYFRSTFEYLHSQLAEIGLKFSNMVGEIFEYQDSKMIKNAHRLSTRAGDSFKYWHSQMAEIANQTILIHKKFNLVTLGPQMFSDLVPLRLRRLNC